MAFTKNDVQEELMSFMSGFALSVERVYGSEVGATLADQGLITKSCLWQGVSGMYDYGMAGIPDAELGSGVLDGIYADTELFIRGLESLDGFLAEDSVSLPKLSLRTVRTAVARHVLEGGKRYSDFSLNLHGLGNGDGDRLTLAEVALLADMDERSVRNAANPKLPGALKTESVGTRALVMIDEARRWLANRKGFVPTQQMSVEKEKTVKISLPMATVEQLNTRASQEGLSVDEYLKHHLAACRTNAAQMG